MKLSSKTGKPSNKITWRKKHNFQLGTLVEITCDDSLCNEEDQHNGLRLFVVEHTRDCDGTPLYGLSFDKIAGSKFQTAEKDLEKNLSGTIEHFLTQWSVTNIQGSILPGFPEESLKVV